MAPYTMFGIGYVFFFGDLVGENEEITLSRRDIRLWFLTIWPAAEGVAKSCEAKYLMDVLASRSARYASITLCYALANSPAVKIRVSVK